MWYSILVTLTLIQTIVTNWMMGLIVFDTSPFIIRLWSNYLAAALVFWSPLLFTNKRRWTYVVAILLNIWFIGNLMYFRSYGDVLNRWCMLNASNLDGIWSSILPFLRWGDLFFLCVTLLWIILSETFKRGFFLPLWKRITIAFIAFIVCCLPQTLIHKKADLPISPFSSYYTDVSMGRVWYFHTFGAITHFVNEAINLVTNREGIVEPIKKEELTNFIQKPDSVPEQGNILIILFESLEDWTIGLQVDGQEVTPNINRLVEHPMTGHYPMTAQVKEGKSSDAQLIIFNGLLPIHNGAASMRYPSYTYPSFVKHSLAKTKHMYAAYPYHMWNQQMNAITYGFNTLYANDVSDFSIMDSVKSSLKYHPRPFILTAITMASHSPFIKYADRSSFSINNSTYDDTHIRYLKCVHYTDSAIGGIITTILSDSTLASTTRIVITGDHPIFDLVTPVPFIIYDPFIPPVFVNRQLYQIDIYTTLVARMHIATPWHGLGKNISDSCAYTLEEIRHLESLSDRIIQTNYFATCKLTFYNSRQRLIQK